MSAAVTPPTEAETVEFLEKLSAFHDSLSPSEQRILDQMTVSALAHEEGEVQGYALETQTNMSMLANVLSTSELLANRPYYRQIVNVLKAR